VTHAAAEAQCKRPEAADESASSSSSSDSDDDDDVKKATQEAKKKAAEEEAQRKAEEEAKREKEDEQQNPEAHLGPAAKQRLANVRLLRKLVSELRDSQAKLRELVSAVPTLLPGVTVAQKEAVFQQLAELLAAAEQPIAQRWYESGPRRDASNSRAAAPSFAADDADAATDTADAADAADADASAALEQWAAFVAGQLQFLFHAADAATLPVPASLEARLLRQAALIDGELTAQMLRTQLLQRVLLFAPETAAGSGGYTTRSQRPQLVELTSQLETAVGKLTSPVAPA